MTPMAHRLPPCGGTCATCQPRRDRLWALAILAAFILVFVVPTVLRWHG